MEKWGLVGWWIGGQCYGGHWQLRMSEIVEGRVRIGLMVWEEMGLLG